MAICELCEREVKEITKHHLIPKSKGGTLETSANLCRTCHSTIHHRFSNQELASTYYTLEALKNAEVMQGYIKWIKKQKRERFRNKRSN